MLSLNLSVLAEDHADELAKAREGYLEIKAVHEQIATMEAREKKTYACYEQARDEAAAWKAKCEALEKERSSDLAEMKVLKDTLADTSSRHRALESFVLDHCKRILGEFCFPLLICESGTTSPQA